MTNSLALANENLEELEVYSEWIKEGTNYLSYYVTTITDRHGSTNVASTAASYVEIYFRSAHHFLEQRSNSVDEEKTIIHRQSGELEQNHTAINARLITAIETEVLKRRSFLEAKNFMDQKHQEERAARDNLLRVQSESAHAVWITAKETYNVAKDDWNKKMQQLEIQEAKIFQLNTTLEEMDKQLKLLRNQAKIMGKLSDQLHTIVASVKGLSVAGKDLQNVVYYQFSTAYDIIQRETLTEEQKTQLLCIFFDFKEIADSILVVGDTLENMAKIPGWGSEKIMQDATHVKTKGNELKNSMDAKESRLISLGFGSCPKNTP